MEGWMDGCIDGWMDGCIDGWMAGRIDGSMDNTVLPVIVAKPAAVLAIDAWLSSPSASFSFCFLVSGERIFDF